MLINLVELWACGKICMSKEFTCTIHLHFIDIHPVLRLKWHQHIMAHNSNNRLLHMWLRMICITRWHKRVQLQADFSCKLFWTLDRFIQYFFKYWTLIWRSMNSFFSHIWILWIIYFSYLAELIEEVIATVELVTEEAEGSISASQVLNNTGWQ